ncbi:MAG: carbohydrate binding family 9 domain-containing protein [Gemmatimonadetes bacterium]|nr:carbohydrate binding family 9 domain-containing protein [Gemmatimonadota bacterium]
MNSVALLTRCGLLAAASLLAGFASAAAAQAEAPAAPPPGRVEARAARIAGAGPQIDGRLDEAAWQQAAVITGFVQKHPDEGAPASARTEVRVLYDDRAVYVGARMYSDDPASIQAPVGRRDQPGESDQLLVSLDTWHDRRTAYTFGVTAAGVRLDLYHPGDREEAQDWSFDPVWEARAHRDSLGWTAEMRIPFSQLRFNRGASQRWGLNVKRVVPARNEESYWVMVPRNEAAWASRFGVLADLEGIRPARRIELSPYAATAATLASTAEPGDPFTDGRDYSVRAGADLKAGLGPNLTLQATVNPDFGQVELDPAQVNLTAFETFFPERRPFFVEGSQLLQGGGAGYFYSRRIGAAPRGPAPGTFVDRPDHTTILGAAKVTGRLPSGLSVGALAALTAREEARTFDAEGGTFRNVEVEPLTAYGVGRLQQQFGPAGSTAGVIFTGVRRELDAGEPLARLLNRQAVAGAADWNLRFRGGEYELRGHLGASRVDGDSAAILRQQRSSVRYFQRPDAGYVAVDPSRTSLSGYAGGLGLARNSGKHWLWETSVDFASPGFELNDAGRLASTDEVFTFAALRYRENRPGPVLRSYSVGASAENGWNFGGVHNFSTVRGIANATWTNFWTSSFSASVDLPALSDNLTRGGPLMRTPLAWATIAQVGGPASAPTRWHARVYYGRAEEAGPTYRVSGGVSVRPGPRWQLGVEPNYVHFAIPRQYIGALPDGPERTFGRRYVFSHVGLTEFRVPVRLNYALRPDLTLETYLEPYASSARFTSFGELAAARSGRVRRYGTDGTTIEPQPDGSLRVTDGAAVFELPDPDFNVRSLRSNAVLRWEWAQGSTLFLVWQQDRFRERPGGARVRPWSLGETLSTDGDNFLALKVTYWVGM